MAETAKLGRVPERFTTRVFVPEDVTRFHGSVVVPAGVYDATPDEPADEDHLTTHCTVWVPSGKQCRLCNGTGRREYGYMTPAGSEPWDPDSEWGRACNGCNSCNGTGADATNVGLPAYRYTRTENPPMPIPEPAYAMGNLDVGTCYYRCSEPESGAPCGCCSGCQEGRDIDGGEEYDGRWERGEDGEYAMPPKLTEFGRLEFGRDLLVAEALWWMDEGASEEEAVENVHRTSALSEDECRILAARLLVALRPGSPS